MNKAKEYAKQLLQQALDDPMADFREGQWEAIASLVHDRSRSLVVQRTGWGKSIIYFLATRLLRDQGIGPTFIISPLLSLMRNQITAAERLGLSAATINSSNNKEWSAIIDQLNEDKIDILFISPERLGNAKFQKNILRNAAIRDGLFVIDEAHCISDWGHDFRPDYQRIIHILHNLPPNIPVLATTATANDRVVEDIIAQLGKNLNVIRGSLARDSLQLQNLSLPTQAERMAWLAEFLPKLSGSGIIYTLTVRDAKRLAEWLQSKNIEAYAYWGSLENEVREQLEQDLLNNRLKALVATTALGMGFDKPDLGFVIHFQRPGSVVHYYQQVGRAGRAIADSFGILMSGNEDEDITNYFIQSAFPPEAHVTEVLNALDQAENGLTIPMIERYLNISNRQISKVLKLLAVKSPSSVTKEGSRWYATAVKYASDQEKIDHLTMLRITEQEQLKSYTQNKICLMSFLRNALDDPNTKPCGRCAVCVGKPLLPESCSNDLVVEAIRFLKHGDQVISPRKQWPSNALEFYDWNGRIPPELLFEEGRAICTWGDAGWGTMVKQGKQRDGYFDDQLVDCSEDLVQSRWRPNPFPTWVTCVPSLKHPALVSNFAERLAAKLGIPFVPCIQKIRHSKPQKLMENSFQQAHNLVGAFQVDVWEGITGPVLLVDDMVDSKWTFTIISALLREANSGPVYPFALAQVQAGGW